MPKGSQGFASMSRDQQRSIASLGGQAAHKKGTAHEWTSEEARAAGRLGGIKSGRNRRERAASDFTPPASVVHDDSGTFN